MEKFRTKKSLGQHFLNSETVPRWLCDAGEITAADTVLEIGPGTGALTKEILSRGATVIALEADPRAIEVLNNDFAEYINNGKLYLEHADVRQFNPDSLNLQEYQFKVVANIPYYLTGRLFRTFLAETIQPSLLVFLIQKEVAKRAVEDIDKGGKESLLSLSIKTFGTPEYIKTVGRGHFSPPPKVDSAIIKVSNISRDRLAGVDPEAFFNLLHIGFGSKRKQLLGNLAKDYPREKLANIFDKLSLSQSVRAEDVNLQTWLSLAKEIL